MDRHALESTRSEFKDGARPETACQAPGGHTASHLSHNIPAIEEDKIDGEPHPEGVYSLARHDPQAFAVAQGLPAEQTSAAGCSVIGYFHAMRNHGLRSQVVNLEHAQGVTTRLYAIGFQADFRGIHK
jgi:hypothetical protein